MKLPRQAFFSTLKPFCGLALGMCVTWLGCTRGSTLQELTPRPVLIPGRIAFLAGASGETVEPNFFIEDLRGFRTVLLARGWKVSVVAGASDGLLPGSLTATNENLMNGVKAALQSAGAGQEALLVFHSHGREQETFWGQRSHSIVSEDGDGVITDPGFDLDALEPELLKAQARGVKVALVDLSCYSGSTQALKGAACTVSLAAARYVSLCSGRPEERHFNSRFFNLPAREVAVNLESQFLEARRSDGDSINLPQISSRPTPALKGWEGFLVRADPLDTFEDLKDLHTGTPAFDPKDILSEIGANVPPALRAEIANQLTQTLTLRKDLEAQMPALAKDYDSHDLVVKVPGRNEVKLGPAYLAELLQAVQDRQMPEAYTDAQLNLVKQMGPLASGLASQYSAQLSQYQARRDRFDQTSEAFMQAADTLFKQERLLYDVSGLPMESNPCREFVF